jgi:hypothetical protein
MKGKSMSTAVVREIPAGAEVTVTLKNGKSFKGIESTGPELFKEGLLRMEAIIIGEADGDRLIFVTAHDQVSCFELHSTL